MSKITEYFKDTKAELKHVIWPNKKETIRYTLAVILLSIIVAYLLGVFDYGFLKALQQILGN